MLGIDYFGWGLLAGLGLIASIAATSWYRMHQLYLDLAEARRDMISNLGQPPTKEVPPPEPSLDQRLVQENLRLNTRVAELEMQVDRSRSQLEAALTRISELEANKAKTKRTMWGD